VAVERGAPVVARHPLVEEGGARLAVEGLERDVGEVVRRVSVPRVLLQGSLREPARLVEAVHLVIGEGERGLVPPVVTVGGGQALHERDPILLSVGGAGQGDRAAHLVHQHRVAREFLHVLVGQREAPRALAVHEGAEGLHVLALAPRPAAHRLPRAGHRGARGGGVARDEGQQGPAGVRHREAGVGLHRLGEPRLALGAIGQQVVHAFLEALEGDGRVGGDGQAVTVGERHGKGPQTSRVRGSSIRSASAPRKRAPRAPSRARWSQERVSTIVGCTAGLPSTGITRSVMRPTARIAAWGGLTMALNASTPYMPRLLIVKTPPWISAGRSLPACARATRSSRRAAISLRPRVSARWITGTTSPSSSATARPTLTSGCRSITPSLHETATRGCCTMAAATSLIRRSVYVMRTPVWARALSSHAPSRATATSRTRKKCGALVHDAAIRSAITRHTVPTFSWDAASSTPLRGIPPPSPAATPSPLWGEGRVRGLEVRGAEVRGPEVGGAVPVGSAAAGTSIASTAPSGPDPFSARRSIPRSAANRRALGDAATIVPGPPLPAVATVRRLSTYARTSAFSILPLAVRTCARSTLCASATLRASGEALMRSDVGPSPCPLP